MFRGASDIAGKYVLNLLKAFNLCERKSVVKKITIIQTRVNKGSGDSSGGGKVNILTDTTEVANVVMAGAIKEEIYLEKR